MTEPRWLLQSVVEVIHEMQMAEHGGLAGIRDAGLLSSALARPQNLYEYEGADIFRLAAAYAYGLVSNHPFADGNKRTALLGAYTFLHINGFVLSASEVDATARVIALAAGEITEVDFAQWLKAHTLADSDR